MSVIQFPRTASTPKPPVDDSQVAAASLVSAFIAYSLPGLEDIAGLIQGKLEAMDDDAVYGEMVRDGASTEMVMLDEIVSDEVARRCLKNGWSLPWQDPEDEVSAANDQPQPDGVA